MVAFKQAAVTAAFPNFEAFFGDCVKKSYVRTLFYYVLAYYYINTTYFCVTSEDSKNMASATQIETSPAASDHSEKHLWHKGQSLDDEVRSLNFKTIFLIRSFSFFYF